LRFSDFNPERVATGFNQPEIIPTRLKSTTLFMVIFDPLRPLIGQKTSGAAFETVRNVGLDVQGSWTVLNVHAVHAS
jgi:hypothetical protein